MREQHFQVQSVVSLEHDTVKSHFKALGLYNFIRGFGGLISGWAYKRNKKNVSERQDKTYLRIELELTCHYILNLFQKHL